MLSIILIFFTLNQPSFAGTPTPAVNKPQRLPAQDAYTALKVEFEKSPSFLDISEAAKKTAHDLKDWDKAFAQFKQTINEHVKKLPNEISENDKMGNFKAMFFEDLISLAETVQKPNCTDLQKEKDNVRYHANPNSDSTSNVSSAAKTWILFLDRFCN